MKPLMTAAECRAEAERRADTRFDGSPLDELIADGKPLSPEYLKRAVTVAWKLGFLDGAVFAHEYYLFPDAKEALTL